MASEIAQIRLEFGNGGVFVGTQLRQRLFLNWTEPNCPNLPEAAIAQVLEFPLGIPALKTAIVTGDRIVLIVDRDTPQAPLIIAQLWEVLAAAGIVASDVTLLLPAAIDVGPDMDLRSELPHDVAQQIQIIKHDPLEPGECNYLASAVSGERVYLSRHVLEADFVIPVGPIGPDPLLGYRGGVSCLYPGLSDAAAIRKSIGQGHEELGTDEVRPLRQLVDEVSWLLGVQFCVGVVPGAGSEFTAVFAGTPDAVLRAGRTAYEAAWLVPETPRCELVIAAIPTDASGHHWEQIGRAADTARKLVEKAGRIVILSQVQAEPGPGLRMLAAHRSAKSALKPLRTVMPPDILTATRIARAANWAHVYLLSGRPANEVEDMFLYPIDDLNGVQRLLDNDDSTAILAGSQHVQAQN